MYCNSNFSLFYWFTVVSTNVVTIHMLQKQIHSKFRLTVVLETLVVCPLIHSFSNCSTVAWWFARTHWHSHCSSLSSMARGAAQLPCHLFSIVSFCHVWYTFTTAVWEQFIVSKMLLSLAQKSIIIYLCMSDKSLFLHND